MSEDCTRFVENADHVCSSCGMKLDAKRGDTAFIEHTLTYHYIDKFKIAPLSHIPYNFYPVTRDVVLEDKNFKKQLQSSSLDG